MPTILGTDDFAHAIDSGYYTDGFGSSGGYPVAVTSPLYHSQPRTLRITSDGNNIFCRHNITGSRTMGYAAIAFRTPAKPASGSVHVLQFSVATTSKGTLWITPNGLYLSNSSNFGTTTDISVDTWYWIELIFDVSTGTHNIYGRVNGIDLNTPTGHTAAADTAAYSQLNSLAGDPSGHTSYYGVWMYGYAASTTDWLGMPAAPRRNYKRLYGPAQLTATPTDLYTTPAGTQAVIRKTRVNNPSPEPVDFTMSVGTDAASTRLWDAYEIAGNGSPHPSHSILDDHTDHTLAAGEKIQGSFGFDSSPYAAEVLADGPVAYYRLDQADGFTLDSSGNGHTLTAADGRSQLDAASLIASDTSNRACEFDNGDTSTVFDLTDSTDLEFADGEPFTVECWISFVEAPDTVYRRFQAWDDEATGNNSYSFTVQSANGFGFFRKAGGVSSGGYIMPSGGLSVGPVYHVVGIYDGTDVYTYVNGSSQKSTPVTAGGTMGAYAGEFRVGGGQYGGSSVHAVVDEVAVYPTTLSAARVQAHYDAAKPPVIIIDGYEEAV